MLMAANDEASSTFVTCSRLDLCQCTSISILTSSIVPILEVYMSGSCCGGSTKSEPTKVVTTIAQKPSERAADKSAAKSEKSDCCNAPPSKVERTGCGC